MSRLRRGIWVAIFASLAVSACGQIQPQGQLPVIVLPNRASQTNRPSVWIEATYFYDWNDGQGQPIEGTSLLYAFRKLLEKVTRESTLFSEVTVDLNDRKDADLNIKMDYRGSVQFKDVLSNPMGQIITLGYGPINAIQKCKITATVLDRNLKQLGTYTVEDAIDISLGPFAGLRIRWDRNIFEDVVENMVKNIYRQMLDDNVLGQP